VNAFKHLDPKHLEDIKAVIEEYFVVPLSPYSSSDLEIVITGHDTFKGQYKIGDSESSKKAWKELFETLQRRLLQRLKSAQSFCRLTPHSVTCEFCKRNHALLALPAGALEASQDMTRRIKQEKE
jgi:hypothetical protein